MNDGMQYAPIQGKVAGPSELEILPLSKAVSSTIYNGRWQLTMDS